MNQIINNNIKLTSLDIAEVIEKRHADIMRDIRKETEELGEGIAQRIFTLGSYKDKNNQDRPCYEFGKDGAMQLALKYDAKTRYKVIMRIEELEGDANKPMSPTELAFLQAQNVLELEQTVQKHDSKITLIERKVNEQITLQSGEQRRLQRAVAARVYKLHADKEDRPQAFGALHREIKDRFGVASYKDVRRQDLQAAINYVDNWIPRRVAV